MAETEQEKRDKVKELVKDARICMLTTMTSGARAVRAITSRSRCGSKFAFFSTSGITAVLKSEASSV